MKKIKVVTILGTRPEIIRLSRVMALLDSVCNQVIVHTGQNYDYELNEIFFSDLNVKKPDYFLKNFIIESMHVYVCLPYPTNPLKSETEQTDKWTDRQTHFPSNVNLKCR